MVQIHKYYLNLPVNLRETPSYEMEFNNGGICDDQSWTEHLLQATLCKMTGKYLAAMKR